MQCEGDGNKTWHLRERDLLWANVIFIRDERLTCYWPVVTPAGMFVWLTISMYPAPVIGEFLPNFIHEARKRDLILVKKTDLQTGRGLEIRNGFSSACRPSRSVDVKKSLPYKCSTFEIAPIRREKVELLCHSMLTEELRENVLNPCGVISVRHAWVLCTKLFSAPF